MRDYNQRKPTGFDAESRFDQAVWDRTHGQRANFNNSSTVKVSSTSKGITLHAAPASSGGVILSPYVVTTLFGAADYVGAKRWNPAANSGAGDFTGSEVKVAKFISSQQPESEFIDGVQFNYDYTLDNFRFCYQDETLVEYQVCHPRYRAYSADAGHDISESLIYVARVQGGTGILDDNGRMIFLAEINARFWAYQNGQTGPPS